MPETRPLRVFLCHASQDKPAVRDLYNRLQSESWIDPWLDEEKLLPGMDWDLEIYKAIRDADVIIVCLSNDSVAKEGYVQREFKRALYLAEEKPEGAIYVIPLRLDDCVPPSKFQKWQWLDYFASNAHERLLKSLNLRARNLKLQKDFSSDKPAPVITPTKQSVAPLMKPASTKKTPGEHLFYIFGGLEFVKVSAGDFYMGADDVDAYEGAAKPQHLVYQLDYDFYMARFPLTNRQYGRIARASGKPVIVSKKNANHPVVEVSWYDVQEYIQWLNEQYSAELPDGYRFCLPSEAEWGKAARGPDGNEYPWGDAFDAEKCNTDEGGRAIPRLSVSIRRKVTRHSAARIWRAMCGSGRAACGARMPPHQHSSILTASMTSAKMRMPIIPSCAFCGAGRSAIVVSTPAVRLASGTTRTSTTSATAFGWRCPLLSPESSWVSES